MEEEAEEERIELERRREGGFQPGKCVTTAAQGREAGFKLYRNSGACMLSGLGSFMEANSMKSFFAFHK